MHPILSILLELAALCVACILLVQTGGAAAWGSFLLAFGLILYHAAALIELIVPSEGY